MPRTARVFENGGGEGADEVETQNAGPVVNRGDVRAWIDAYVDAWRTYDPASVGALFAEDAAYAYHPYDEGDEVLRGREAIVASWLEEKDEPGSWEASYHPSMVEGDRAVVQGTTSYADGDFFWNLWVLRFDGEGRCAEFVEWFMTRPQDETSATPDR